MNASQTTYTFIGPGAEFKGTITVDGKPHKGAFSSIPQKTIYVVDSMVVDTGDVTDISTTDMIVVTTKKATANQYKEIFGRHSADYKKYLAAHKNSDQGIDYLIVNDRILIASNDKNRLNMLSRISGEEIKNISLSKAQNSQGQTTTIAKIQLKD